MNAQLVVIQESKPQKRAYYPSAKALLRRFCIEKMQDTKAADSARLQAASILKELLDKPKARPRGRPCNGQKVSSKERIEALTGTSVR